MTELYIYNKNNIFTFSKDINEVKRWTKHTLSLAYQCLKNIEAVYDMAEAFDENTLPRFKAAVAQLRAIESVTRRIEAHYVYNQSDEIKAVIHDFIKRFDFTYKELSPSIKQINEWFE